MPPGASERTLAFAPYTATIPWSPFSGSSLQLIMDHGNRLEQCGGYMGRVCETLMQII